MLPEPLLKFLLLIFLSTGVTNSTSLAENFRCADSEITSAAEAARIRSARFWTGCELPGTWYTPCPIKVIPGDDVGSGRTTFQFGNGEVFGWSMEITGSRSSLLEDVLPHEVDHMVRASLVRHRVERWLDEGCASLMESCRVHDQLRTKSAQLSTKMITLNWLSARDYPASVKETEELYVAGFSLVEFLLERGTVNQLLQFQLDDNPIPSRLARYYGLSVESLQREWGAWKWAAARRRCQNRGCPLSPVPASEVTLTIWTATWCEPCRQLKADWEADGKFREALQRGFQIQWRNFDTDLNDPSRVAVRSLPAFIRGSKILSGYTGQDDLLNRLGLPAQPTPLDTENTITIPVESHPREELVGEQGDTQLPSPNATANMQGRTRILDWLPSTFTALQWCGVIGGSVLTGGVGGVSVTMIISLLRWRRRVRGVSRALKSTVSERRGVADRAPFPRDLDEAGELLELRQAEGRVATLDTLRGMFLEDELEKLAEAEPTAAQLISKVRRAIDLRVDEVAPLTTSCVGHQDPPVSGETSTD